MQQQSQESGMVAPFPNISSVYSRALPPDIGTFTFFMCHPRFCQALVSESNHALNVLMAKCNIICRNLNKRQQKKEE